jgi:hypothetical protein
MISDEKIIIIYAGISGISDENDEAKNKEIKEYLERLIDGLSDESRIAIELELNAEPMQSPDFLIMYESYKEKPTNRQVENKKHWKHKQKKNSWERRIK